MSKQAGQSPARRVRRRLVLALSIAGALTLAGLLLAVSVGVYSYVRYQDERNTAERQLSAYLSDLSTGHLGAAYARLCAEAQEDESAPEFDHRMVTRPQLVNFHLGGVSLAAIGDRGDRVYEVSVDETYEDGATVTRRYQVAVVRDGQSPVCPTD